MKLNNTHDKMATKTITYRVYVFKELHNPLTEAQLHDMDKYKYKDIGYLYLQYACSAVSPQQQRGFLTPAELKQRLGIKQWNKFCQGKRIFKLNIATLAKKPE